MTIAELYERLKHCQQQAESCLRHSSYAKAKEWELEAEEVREQIRKAWSR